MKSYTTLYHYNKLAFVSIDILSWDKWTEVANRLLDLNDSRLYAWVEIHNMLSNSGCDSNVIKSIEKNLTQETIQYEFSLWGSMVQ